MKHEMAIETRAEGDGDDPLAAVTAAVQEIRTAQEQFQTRTDQRLETDLAALRTRLDAIDTRSQRPGAGGGTERTDEAGQRWLTAEVVLAPLAPADYIVEMSGTVKGAAQTVLAAIRVTR